MSIDSLMFAENSSSRISMNSIEQIEKNFKLYIYIHAESSSFMFINLYQRSDDARPPWIHYSNISETCLQNSICICICNTLHCD